MVLKLRREYKDFDGFFFDCDGVLWEENHLLDGAKNLLEILYDEGKKVCFLSNNSTKSLKQYIQKFDSLGIPVDKEQVIISSEVTVKYCQQKNYPNKTVFIIGEDGLKQTFQESGFKVSLENDPEKKVDAVIVGMDRSFNYDKLTIALRYCLVGADFIGTNPDPQFPTPNGFSPGAGSMIGSLQAALGYGPEKICGKPDPLMAEIMLERFQLSADKTIMIGDRVSTDMKVAINAHLKPILIKTGFGNEEYRKFSDFPYYKVINNLKEIFV